MKWRDLDVFGDTPRSRSSRARHRPLRASHPGFDRMEARALLAVAVSDITAAQGVLFQGEVATFAASDVSNPNTARASIDWGDGTSASSGVIQPATAGGYRILANHIYETSGIFVVTITVTGSDSTQAAGQGAARVVANPLTSEGATLNAVAGTTSTLVYASFFDARTGKTTSDYSASITFGDGTTGIGTITGGPSPAAFFVSAGHAYRFPAVFTYSVAITSRAEGGLRTTATGSVNAAAPESPQSPIAPEPFVGALDESFDTGRSDTDLITNTPMPRFLGFARPFSVVFVYGRRFDHKEPTLLARAAAQSDGSWSTFVGPLSDGRYVITATVSAAGPGSANPATAIHYVICSENKPLVIDTVALSVVRVYRITAALWRGLRQARTSPGQLQVVLRQDLSGIDKATLENPNNYTLLAAQRSRGAPRAAKAIAAKSVRINPALARVVVDFGRAIPRHATLLLSGIRDIAGNPLAGEFPTNGAARRSWLLPYR